MKITFQVSLYPVGQPDFKKPIDDFIGDLKKDNIKVDVHETSTIGGGDIEKVFNSLRKAYVEASKSGDVVMVLTVVNGAPAKEELERLNRKSDHP